MLQKIPCPKQLAAGCTLDGGQSLLKQAPEMRRVQGQGDSRGKSSESTDFAFPEMVVFYPKKRKKMEWLWIYPGTEIVHHSEWWLPPKSLLAGNTHQTMFNDEFSNQLILDYGSVIGGSEQGDLGFNTPELDSKAPGQAKKLERRINNWVTSLGPWNSDF